MTLGGHESNECRLCVYQCPHIREKAIIATLCTQNQSVSNINIKTRIADHSIQLHASKPGY